MPDIDSLGLDLDGIAQQSNDAEPDPEVARAAQAIKQAQPQPKARARPWQAEALVLPLQEQLCRCGASQTVVAGQPKVRFRNQRTGADKMAENGAAELNPHLPRETIWLNQQTILACPACWQDDAPDQLHLALTGGECPRRPKAPIGPAFSSRPIQED